MVFKAVNKIVIKERLEHCKGNMLADISAVKEMTPDKLKGIIVTRWNEFCKDDLAYNRVRILDGKIVPEINFDSIHKEFSDRVVEGRVNELKQQFDAIKDAFVLVDKSCEEVATKFNELDQNEKRRLFEEKIFKGVMIAGGSIGVLLAIACATVVTLPFSIPGGLLMLGAIAVSSAGAGAVPKVFEGHFEKVKKSADQKVTENFEGFKSNIAKSLVQMENSITLSKTIEQVVQRGPNVPGPESRWAFD